MQGTPKAPKPQSGDRLGLWPQAEGGPVHARLTGAGHRRPAAHHLGDGIWLGRQAKVLLEDEDEPDALLLPGGPEGAVAHWPVKVSF